MVNIQEDIMVIQKEEEMMLIQEMLMQELISSVKGVAVEVV